MVNQIQTVLGPVSLDELGETMMHEHVFFWNWGEEDKRAASVAYAREELGKLAACGARTVVDVVPLLEELCLKHVPEAEAEGLALEYELPSGSVMLYADPHDVEGIVNNLISNAIKYTPHGGRVEVRSGVRDDHLEVRVSDTGIGISDEDQAKLFRQFFRGANARTHTAEGTGLGLAIVQRILDRYDGRIEVESRPGKGATFLTRIPLPYCELPDSGPGGPASPPDATDTPVG